MTDIGLFLFPWDLADEGIDRVMGFAAESGITTLYMASVYHAGLFLQPHNPVRRVYLLEDGVSYFHPRMEFYGRIRPKIAQVSRDTDWFEAAAAKSAEFGLKVSAWTVCMHNSRLGEAYPDVTVRNAFGDPRPYALCPSHPDVAAYMRALARDLARYRLESLLLEAFRYMDVVHGAHHERWSIPLGPLERELLSLSFADTDLTAAGDAGVDGTAVRERVRVHLDEFFEAYPKAPAKLPRTLAEFEAAHPEVAAYREALRSVMDRLLDSVRSEVAESGVQLAGQGQQDFNITITPGKAGFDAVLRAVYDDTPEQAGESVREAKRNALDGQKVYAGVKLGFGAIRSARRLAEVVSAVREAGAAAVLFYNYAECAPAVLRWIAPAVKGRRAIGVPR